MRNFKRRILFVFIFLSFFSFLCEGKELKNISLKEVLSIGGLENDVLYMWAWVTVDNKGNIYVTDSIDCSIKKFNSKGVLIKKAGGEGQGPGEFLAPRLIFYRKGMLYVTDEKKRGIQVFDEELNYKFHIPINLPIFDFNVLCDGNLVVSAFPLNKNDYGKLLIYDLKGYLKDRVKYCEGLNPILETAKFEIDKNFNFYVIFTWQDKIVKINRRSGKKLWSRSLFGKKSIKIKEIGPVKVPVEVIYKDIAFDNFGNLFILTGSISKNRSRDVYVLDKEGNLLTTFTLPDSSHCIYIDKNNFLYTRADMGATLKKFLIKYEYR